MFSIEESKLTGMAKAVLFQDYNKSRFLNAQVPLPDMCINELALCSIVGKNHNVPTIFGDGDNKIKSGCYEFYIKHKETDREISLYIGRAYDLRVRLNQHLGGKFGSNWKEGYRNEMLDNQMLTNEGELMGFDQMGGGGINIWELEKDRDRMYFEHVLIGNLKPIYNKD